MFLKNEIHLINPGIMFWDLGVCPDFLVAIECAICWERKIVLLET